MIIGRMKSDGGKVTILRRSPGNSENCSSRISTRSKSTVTWQITVADEMPGRKSPSQAAFVFAHS